MRKTLVHCQKIQTLLNSTKHIISTSSPEQVAKGEERYNEVVDRLEEFVSNNANLKLTKRLVRKTVGESKAENKDKLAVDKIPTDTKAAFSELNKVTGTGKDVDDKTAVENVLKLFKTGTFDVVVPESGIIDDELKTLENVLTGKVSENIEETFDVVKESLQGKNIKSFAAEAEDVVLGTGPSTVLEEVDYDDYTRSVDAERVIHTILGSGKKFSKEFKTKAAVFGLTNGIEKNKVREIIKSYESVEDEAVRGKRGYVSRLNRLQSLVESSNPNNQAINKEYDEITSMYSGILNSEQALERGIKAAKQEAAKMNKHTTVTKSFVPFQTEYKKADGKLYSIYIRKVDGVWTADVADAETLKATKNKYTKAISKGLSIIAARTKGRVGNVSMSSGKIKIPVKENKSKKLREQDVNYIEKISEITDEIIPDSDGVSKVILGQKTHDKWATKGDYYKANMPIINSDTFTDKDVVLVDSIGLSTSKDGKRYRPDLGEAAAKSIKAAVEAGATFVLDSAMVQGTSAKSNPRQAAALAGYLGVKSKGYTRLEGKDKYIFVKETAENKKAVRERKAKLEAEKDEHNLITDSKQRAVSLHRALNEGLSMSSGKPLADAARKTLEKEYADVRKLLLEKSFKEEDKLTSYLERESRDSVVKEAKAVLNAEESTPPIYDDKVFEKAVKDFIIAESDKDAQGAELLDGWKSVLSEGLNRKERETKVAELLAALGLEAKSIVKSTLDEKSFSKGKDDLYENVYKAVTTGEIIATPSRKNMTDKEYDEKIAKNDTTRGHVYYGRKHVFVGTRRVVQDITKIVDVTKTTVANTVSMDYLPFGVRDSVKDFSNNAKKALGKVEAAELAEQTYSRDDKGRVLPGGFNLHNSPARGLFFNNEGDVNEDVMVATYLALGDALVSDKSAMSRGWKSDYDVAQMFGVQEFEVSYDMRKFAYEHGSLLKTAANSIGKNVLSQLGITKKVGEDISSNEFESLLADVGNTALLIAEEQGLIKSNTENSNNMAKLYKDGEERQLESVTHFVHISDKVDTTEKFARNVPIKKVEDFVGAYDKVSETMPEASTNRKDPFFKAPDKFRLDKAKNEVRNDISGKEVPKDAKETIEILMNTAYTADLERIDEILDAVEDSDSNVKKLLGYINVESDEFNDLYYKDKEVQEAKNNAVDKSLEELRVLKDKILALKTGDVELYFDYFYSSNDRYMLDSNTTNPQVDKLHRFLVVPKDHKLDYQITTNDNGGIEFSVDSDSVREEDKDQSFTVRMAIAQAFGQDVDKMAAEDIITFGNVVLSMDEKQIQDTRKEILKSGKVSVASGGVDYKIDADHLSHTMQALHFLEEVQKAVKGNGSFSSSLSLEFDSLTSGFCKQNPTNAYIRRYG